MDRFSILGQRKLILSSVLVVGVGCIRSTLLLFLADSVVGRIKVVDHDDVEVSYLHRQVIHTEGRRGTSKARYARNTMRALNPTVSVMDVMDPLIWDKTMEIVRGNNYVVDFRNNTRTRYLIKDACILTWREL